MTGQQTDQQSDQQSEQPRLELLPAVDIADGQAGPPCREWQERRSLRHPWAAVLERSGSGRRVDPPRGP